MNAIFLNICTLHCCNRHVSCKINLYHKINVSHYKQYLSVESFMKLFENQKISKIIISVKSKIFICASEFKYDHQSKLQFRWEEWDIK